MANNELQHECELITLRDEGCRIAQVRADDIEAWRRIVAADMQDLIYDQMRLALEA